MYFKEIVEGEISSPLKTMPKMEKYERSKALGGISCLDYVVRFFCKSLGKFLGPILSVVILQVFDPAQLILVALETI